MSLKRLFGKNSGMFKPESLGRYKDLAEDVESIGFIESHIKDKQKNRSHADFATASNFAIYGSLEEYYESSITRIQNEFPYDGSLREKLDYFNDSSGFDLHVFENEYPRTNGYGIFSSHRSGDGWGTRTSLSGNYGNPSSKEYIYIKGGPGLGNVYNTASHQSSNLEIDGHRGNTVEFWLNKSEYVSSKTAREVVLDVTTTGSVEGDHKYGRLVVELDSSDSSKSPFLVTYQSGTAGIKDVRAGNPALYASGSDNSWHHYAFTFQNLSGSVVIRTYVDGDLHSTSMTGSSIGVLNTPMIGAIGSLVAYKDARELGAANASSDREQNPGRGYGKLSGSLDEFRFWKTKRNSKQIGRHWFTQIGAGSNTDTSNSSLGLYYKFNEGVTGIASIDKTVLDYSGRATNGDWVGYSSSARTTKSAMVESSASVTEFKDPILYRQHPLVKSFTDTAKEEGVAYDLTNNSCLYYTVPDYIVQEDVEGGGNTLKKIVQIVASYFDTLQLQIKELAELRHRDYKSFDNKPRSFNDIRLESLGLVTPELFLDANAINIFGSRSEDQEFEQKLHDVKNYIYNNIYNNIESIYKSKGSTKSFRNLFRCFGVDNELIKINTYSTDSRYTIDNSYIERTVKSKYVNFATEKNKNAVVYQSIDGFDGVRTNDARGYITGAAGIFASPLDLADVGFTAQSQIYFPVRYPASHPFYLNSHLSSSLMGCHAVKKSNDALLTWTSESDDDSNFQVFAVRENQDLKDAKFVLSCRNSLFDPIETQTYFDVYDSTRWNLAVSLRQERISQGSVTGSAGNYKMFFQGVRTVSDTVAEEFVLTQSVTSANALKMVSASRRFYVGAHRTDFTGPLNQTSDVKVTNFRYWQKSLDIDEVRAHARDPGSYGLLNPSRLSFPLANIGNVQVPQIDLLGINWDFSNLTGSDSSGQMWVTDVSSGSFDESERLGLLEAIIGRQHPAKGEYFELSTTASVDVEYDHSSKLQEFENVHSQDMVKISLNDDVVFTRESKPTDFFFSFEKSMYGIISDEMLNFFAGVNDFNNLIGAPVEKYRQTYKELNRLRQVFFSRVQNSPDIERFIEYYKWIDSSLSIMIDQLKPASIAASEDIRNMIESHVLERNKYQTKYPTLEMKVAEPVGQIKAINELLYDWKHGHAPVDKGADNNCLWTRERANRSDDILVSGSDSTDPDREIIRRTSITNVSGSTYVIRRLTRPYRIVAEDQRHAKGGDNTFGNKKKRFFTGVSTAHGLSHMVVSGSEAAADSCKDVINPSKKKKVHAPADVAFTENKDRDINDVAPFTLYSSSLDPVSGYQAELFANFKKGVDVTNLHSDEYGDDREVTLQSPFTERFVGGNAHRHQDLSGSLRGRTENKLDGLSRVEAFKLLASGQKLFVLPPNASGLDASNIPIINKDLQTAQVLRDPLAKRPVNIRNYATTTSSISLGNYNHLYDVVQYTTEDQRKDFLVDNLEQMTSSNSTGIPGVQEFSKFSRPVRKSVFKARFAAPGGTEVAGDSRGGQGIDRETNQYSVYNSLNYRNLSVRGPLDFLSKLSQTGSKKDSDSLVTNHKINANPRYRRGLSGATYSGEIVVNKDNKFVTHEIPQNDYQYSWITASLREGIDTAEIGGHLHSFSQASLGSQTGSLRYEGTYEFLTASNREGTRVIDFAGLNTYIVDDLDTATNTVSRSSVYNLTGTIHHRQGPYGWPMWKQIRVGQSRLARYLRDNNTYAIPTITSDTGEKVPVLGPKQSGYSWPNNIDVVTRTKSPVIDNLIIKESPISSNRLPLALGLSVRNAETGLPVGARVVENITFNNSLSTFPTKELSDVLHKEKPFDEQVSSLHSVLNPSSVPIPIVQRDGKYVSLTDEIGGAYEDLEAFEKKDEIIYRIEVYPKEQNTYLEKTRERKRYISDFWRTNRSERTLLNHTNSQGQTIANLSMWPMDAAPDFKTGALLKTTDDNSTQNTGELLSSYSVFHNSTNYPPASALLARPFPIQGKSTLPETMPIHHMKLTASWSADMQQYTGSYNISSRTTDYTPHGGFSVANSVNDSSTLFESAAGFMKDVVNNKDEKFGDSINASTSGPRVDRGHGSSKARTLLFIGGATVAGSVTGNPGTFTGYRFVRILNTMKTPAVLEFHLKTGNSTTVGDSLGIHKATTPFYVQYSADQSTWHNVFKTDSIDEYAVADTFKKVSVLITSSFPNASIRLVSAVTSSNLPSTEGQWAIKFLNLYSAPLRDRIIHPVRFQNDVAYAMTDRMTSTGSISGNGSLYEETILDAYGSLSDDASSRYFTPQETRGHSAISFLSIDNYRDHLLSANGGYQNDSIQPSDDLHNFNFKLAQSGSRRHLVYAKDAKKDEYLMGSQNYQTPSDLNRRPFNYDSYEDFIYQSRLMAKDYGIVPEFRISEHMDYYLNSEDSGQDPFFKCNDNLLSLSGSQAPSFSSNKDFYSVYSHSDFVKHFEVVDRYMKDSGGDLSKITLKCKAFKKFLPYKGFYPADRVTQLAQMFSSSYNQYVTGGHWRNVLSPYYAPGIALNSIKSGIAVDYPIYEPHKDRMYNQYGVIFQSASLNSGTPVMSSANSLHDLPNVDGNISKNRIEVGGGSSWGKTISGSLSAGGDKFGISCWVYLPSSNSTIATAFNLDLTEQQKLGPTVNLGTILSLGSGEDETANAWKTGLHLALSVGDGPNNKMYGKSDGTINTANDFKLFLMGGNGTDYFSYHAAQMATPSVTSGWNHIYVETDINNPTLANTKFFFNSVESTGGKKVQDSDNTSVSAYNKHTIKLDGSRNSFIGSHLGGVKRINTDISDNSKTLTPLPTSFGSYIAGSQSTNDPKDLLKPLEVMMSEMVVVNTSLVAAEIKKLSGFEEVATPPNRGIYRTPNYKLGKTAGPSNPYHAISKTKHDNIVAWYKPGNDVGYTSKTSHSTNLQTVFNHAQNFRSGEIFDHDSGSFESSHRFRTRLNGMPKTLNHLSGTFYGFNAWSGSVAADLKYSPSYRQRWNGIADLSNPSQYSLVYHTSRGHKDSSNPTFKTWYANFGPNSLSTFTEIFDNTTIFESAGADQFSGSVTIVTGSTKIPSYIVGSKFNFTDDASIPRIGSASYGTNHFVGRGSLEDDPVYSQGWVGENQESTGVKNVFRIPFEAIIKPEVYTPKMKDFRTKNVALFYDVEPHQSSSLHPAFVRDFKHTTDQRTNPNKVQSDLVEVQTDLFQSSYATDHNYAMGVVKDSERLKSEFDLGQASTGKKTLYSYAADNFFTECESFFLENPSLVLATRPQLNGSVDETKIYKSSVTLRRGGTPLIKHNSMYSNPSAFGPPVDAGRERTITNDGQPLPRSLEKTGYGFSPYLSPHYDGEATVNYVFTPDPNVNYTSIESVVLDTKAEFVRDISATGSLNYESENASNELSQYNDVAASYNRRFAMHLSESFFNMVPTDDMSFQDGPLGKGRMWVFQPKFVCPTFDFSDIHKNNTSVTAPRTGESTQNLKETIGLWHQGADDFKNEILPSIRINPQGLPIDGEDTDSLRSLSDLIGLKIFDGGPGSTDEFAQLGQVKENKTVHEAVVAIPFRVINGLKKFFDLPPEEVYQAMRQMGFPGYKGSTPEEQQENAIAQGPVANQSPFNENIINNLGAGTLEAPRGSFPRLEDITNISRESVQVRPSVLNMVRSMIKYNIPPQFNFLKYNDGSGKYVSPFAMYLFEFSHTFSRKDLSRIWQNATPDVGLDTYSENAFQGPIVSDAVTHELFGLNDLLNPQATLSSISRIDPDTGMSIPTGGYRVDGWSGGLKADLKWMVFKVKRKAKVDFFDRKRRNVLRLGDSSNPERLLTYEKMSEYGFNWPYDYFSLVELINIEARLTYTREGSRPERQTIDAQSARRFLDGDDNT
jgi:hypothetical protein